MRTLFLILFSCLLGCSTYPERSPRVRLALEEGDYSTAATLARNSANEVPKDSLVWSLEEASALRAQGDLRESAKLFEKVELALRAEEEKPGFSVSNASAAAFTNGYAEAYQPRPTDRIYASTYQALNRIELGDFVAARVAMARLRFVQQSYGLGQLYVRQEEKLDAYDMAKAKDDPATKEGLNRIAANLGPLAAEGTFDDAFSHWLQGMFFLRLGLDAADRERGRKELLAATQLNPHNQAFRQDLQDAESPTSPKAGMIVYIVAETGMCPEWYEQRVDIPLFVLSSQVPYVSVALPALRPSSQDYPLSVQLDTLKVPLTMASRTDGLIAKHFEAALPAIQAKAFASAAIKATTSFLINQSTQEAANRQNAGTGAAILSIASRIGTAVYTRQSTKADLRNWSTLPARFSVARLTARAGQKLSVAGQPLAGLTLPSAKVLLVTLKSTKENLPVSLRSTILVP